MMYTFRSRDRRLAQQTARDIALTLQRDFDTFNPKKTLALSNRLTFFDGYLSNGPNEYPNILWLADSEVDWAFNTLENILTQLSAGAYQKPAVRGGKNPAIWPVSTIDWPWIQSLYASINQAYAQFLTDNNIVVPEWSAGP